MLSAFLCAYAQTDTLRTLRDLQVDYRSPAQGLRLGADVRVTVSALGVMEGIHTLGEADMLHSLSMLPSMGSGSDYASGLSVDGSDFSQSVYTIDGARVFFPYHFGGIFSGLNSAHLSSVSVDAGHSVMSPVCIGSHIRAVSPSGITDAVGGTANVGLLSSSLGVHAPVNTDGTVYGAASISYINALYGHWLDADDNATDYNFSDYNLTYVQRLGAGRSLKLSGFMGSDRLRFNDDDYLLDTRLRWRNAVASAIYEVCNDRSEQRHCLSVSSYSSTLSLAMSQLYMRMPSSVFQAAVNGGGRGVGSHLEWGYRAEFDRFCPQRLDAHGVGMATVSDREMEYSFSASASVSRDWRVRRYGRLVLAVRGLGYVSGSYRRVYIDPCITFEHESNVCQWSVAVSSSTQLMHQLGFSELGLASDFWLPADCRLPAQRALGLDFNMMRGIVHGLSLSGGVFGRLVYRCPQFDGNMVSLLADAYDPYAWVTDAHGFNVGGHVTLNYSLGAVDGWVGYQLAVCRRHFDDTGWCWAANVPLHGVKALVSWHINSKVDVSAYWTLSSGRPYTPVRALFMVGGNVLAEYGQRNSARLPAYHRLDVSATWHLPPLAVGRLRLANFVNFSIINAYGHDNVEMQYFVYDDSNNTISLHRVGSMYRFLPSLSYTVRF